MGVYNVVSVVASGPENKPKHQFARMPMSIRYDGTNKHIIVEDDGARMSVPLSNVIVEPLSDNHINISFIPVKI